MSSWRKVLKAKKMKNRLGLVTGEFIRLKSFKSNPKACFHNFSSGDLFDLSTTVLKLTHVSPERLHVILLAVLHVHQELGDVEEEPDDPADALAEQEEEDGDGHGDVHALDDTPDDSMPATDLDNPDDLDDGLDSDVEVIGDDPYRHQPDNQLGLSDYESPRPVSEEPVLNPHGDSNLVTPPPVLRKAAHLNPEDLSGSGASSSSSSRPGASIIINIYQHLPPK